MTLHDEIPRVDPRSLPLFESRARRTTPHAIDDTAARRPGRVRSSFGRHLADATGPTPARRETALDWKLVATLRSQASELLTKALAEERVTTDRPAQEALGRSLILELLEAMAAEAVTAGKPSWTLAEQDALAQAVFNALFRMGRLQPLIEDDRVENIIITGHDHVWLELLDGNLIEGPPVADSDQELIDFLAFLASRSEVSARPFSLDPPMVLGGSDGECSCGKQGWDCLRFTSAA